MSKKLIALSIVLMLALPVATTAYAIAETELPSDLKLRSVELHKNIMCPKCSGQTLHQSNSPIASSMREVIREELLKGKSNDQIINLMVNAYGKEVLASPPMMGFFALIWILPPIALILGLGAITFVVRRLRHSRPEAELERLVQPQKMKLKIRKSLSMIDQELGENFDIK